MYTNRLAWIVGSALELVWGSAATAAAGPAEPKCAICEKTIRASANIFLAGAQPPARQAVCPNNPERGHMHMFCLIEAVRWRRKWRCGGCRNPESHLSCGRIRGMIEQFIRAYIATGVYASGNDTGFLSAEEGNLRLRSSVFLYLNGTREKDLKRIFSSPQLLTHHFLQLGEFLPTILFGPGSLVYQTVKNFARTKEELQRLSSREYAGLVLGCKGAAPERMFGLGLVESKVNVIMYGECTLDESLRIVEEVVRRKTSCGAGLRELLYKKLIFAFRWRECEERADRTYRILCSIIETRSYEALSCLTKYPCYSVDFTAGQIRSIFDLIKKQRNVTAQKMEAVFTVLLGPKGDWDEIAGLLAEAAARGHRPDGRRSSLSSSSAGSSQCPERGAAAETGAPPDALAVGAAKAKEMEEKTIEEIHNDLVQFIWGESAHAHAWTPFVPHMFKTIKENSRALFEALLKILFKLPPNWHQAYCLLPSDPDTFQNDLLFLNHLVNSLNNTGATWLARNAAIEAAHKLLLAIVSRPQFDSRCFLQAFKCITACYIEPFIMKSLTVLLAFSPASALSGLTVPEVKQCAFHCIMARCVWLLPYFERCFDNPADFYSVLVQFPPGAVKELSPQQIIAAMEQKHKLGWSSAEQEYFVADDRYSIYDSCPTFYFGCLFYSTLAYSYELPLNAFVKICQALFGADASAAVKAHRAKYERELTELVKDMPEHACKSAYSYILRLYTGPRGLDAGPAN